MPWTFVGNHDVTRIATAVGDARHHAHAAALLLTLGGTPAIYYGDEQGLTGRKEERVGGDDAVRPAFPAPGPLPDGSAELLRLTGEDTLTVALSLAGDNLDLDAAGEVLAGSADPLAVAAGGFRRTAGPFSGSWLRFGHDRAPAVSREPAADVAVQGLVSEHDLLVECQGEMQCVEQEIDNLRAALVSARRLGAAIGILMGERRITDDEAFALLTETSARARRSLREVADDVRRTGDL